MGSDGLGSSRITSECLGTLDVDPRLGVSVWWAPPLLPVTPVTTRINIGFFERATRYKPVTARYKKGQPQPDGAPQNGAVVRLGEAAGSKKWVDKP